MLTLAILSCDRWKVRLWQTLLAFTSAVTFIGTYAHGVVMPKATYVLLWKLIYLFLGLTVANIISVAVYDLLGLKATKRLLPWLLVMALGFFGLMQVEGMAFLIFTFYETLAMLFAPGS